MEIVFAPEAKDDLLFWTRSGDKKVRTKIEALLDAIALNPFEGIGKPEQLKHDLADYWSRRITLEHRIAYKVEADKVIIVPVKKALLAQQNKKQYPHL